MKLKYQSYKPWLDACRKIVTAESDFDDIHLVTGEEGQGKSRVMRRLAQTLDPTFTVRPHPLRPGTRSSTRRPTNDAVLCLPVERQLPLRLRMHGAMRQHAPGDSEGGRAPGDPARPDYLIECAEDYRRGLTGGTCSHSLQDIEHVAKGMRDRFETFAKKDG